MLIIAGIITALILLYYFLLMKKNIKKVSSLQDVFKDIEAKYGTDVAQNVEKIYRLETAHFTSTGYHNTGAAGMMSFSSEYPYGWYEFTSYWAENKDYKPIGVVTLQGSDNQPHNYLKFNNFGGFYTLAEFLKNHNNNPGRWNSLDAAQQQSYNNAIDNINISYTA